MIEIKWNSHMRLLTAKWNSSRRETAISICRATEGCNPLSRARSQSVPAVTNLWQGVAATRGSSMRTLIRVQIQMDIRIRTCLNTRIRTCLFKCVTGTPWMHAKFATEFASPWSRSTSHTTCSTKRTAAGGCLWKAFVRGDAGRAPARAAGPAAA